MGSCILHSLHFGSAKFCQHLQWVGSQAEYRDVYPPSELFPLFFWTPAEHRRACDCQPEGFSIPHLPVCWTKQGRLFLFSNSSDLKIGDAPCSWRQRPPHACNCHALSLPYWWEYRRVFFFLKPAILVQFTGLLILITALQGLLSSVFYK